MLDGEVRESGEQRAETRAAALRLCPRVRANSELASASPNHRVAEDKRPLPRQPQRDLVGALDVEYPQAAEELVTVAYRAIKGVTRATTCLESRPDVHAVPARDVSDAALVPVASAHDAGAATPAVYESIDCIPVIDQRIDQDEPARRRDRPPRDALLPAILAALVFGPFRMERLESPEPVDDLTRCPLGHGTRVSQSANHTPSAEASRRSGDRSIGSKAATYRPGAPPPTQTSR